MSPQPFRFAALMLGVVAASGIACAQTWLREDVSFEKVEARARDLASQPYRMPDREALPGWMKSLNYDEYRDIRFRPEQALWKQDGLPFQAMFFHPGYLYREPVKIHEFTSSHSQEVRFTPGFFDYGKVVAGKVGEVPTDAGFAGVRFHAPLNTSDYFDELAVFQGASYWRALGKGQRYGISSRGLAVDTGVDGPEEFPSFREFWMKKPEKNDGSLYMLALLDGPSVSGAYAFLITPGEDTVMTVKAVLFPRKPMKRLGVAPMSSMFWFGENSRRSFDDFRPEVHDSDGLMIRSGSGERIWRPLANDTDRLETNFFRLDKLAGFGLLQRDRRFEAYEDGEAAYHLRPSVWVEPVNDWGSGHVMLMEIPAHNELTDNVVAMWVPEKAPQPGDRLEFLYRQRWTMSPDPAQSGAYTIASRTGLHDWQPEQRTYAVEFSGIPEERMKGDETPEAIVEVTGDGAAKAKIQGVAVQPLPGKRWRAGFQVVPAAEGGKLADIGPIELRVFLKHGEDYLTETWVNRVIP